MPTKSFVPFPKAICTSTTAAGSNVAEDLQDLDQPIFEETLVLNIMWVGPRNLRPAAPPPTTPPATDLHRLSTRPMGVPPLVVTHPSLAQGWDQQQALASSDQLPPQHDWYFDTGATSRMASNTGILSTSFVPSGHSPSSIVVGNGNLLPVISIGTIVLPQVSS